MGKFVIDVNNFVYDYCIYEFINKHIYSVEVYDDDMLSLQFPYKSHTKARALYKFVCVIFHILHVNYRKKNMQNSKRQITTNWMNKSTILLIIFEVLHMGKH